MCHRRWHEADPRQWRRVSPPRIGTCPELRDLIMRMTILACAARICRMSSARHCAFVAAACRADKAEQLLANWLADLAAGAVGRARSTARDSPSGQARSCAGIAEFSPYLFDLIRADADAADPAPAMRSGVASRRADRDHLRTRCWPRPGEADVMRLLAPHEGGSRAPDRAVRHRRRLAGDAGDGGADRSCRRLGADRRCAICCGRKPRAAGCRRRHRIGRKRAAACSCSPWARWARAS